MSILKKPYEISVWEDEWNGSKFVEKRLGIIGSDIMQFQGRAIEPNLTKNVNGVKKFSFKMYHKFIDTVTGEKISNPFADWLISERKVKLKYDGEWYDFIIKNVVENSTNYLYTYQLEDALVQELSKNGFGVVLDEKTIDANGNSNIGTANQLASKVLDNTDWSVDENSEAFVQTIDEALVYLTLPDDLSELDIKHIKDQTDLKIGVIPEPVNEEQKNSMKGQIVLGFYSSCTNKPHRFQFIYISDLADLERDENRYIKNNNNCQYYIDYKDPNSNYNVSIASLGLFLPEGFNITTVDEDGQGYGVTLSSKYRGKRYGFSQQSKYIPVLDRYVNLYTDSNEKLIYGYQHVEYKSPAFTQNMISNSSFDSTSGWTGTHNGEGTNKATVENVYGRFDGNNFIDSTADLQNGSFEENINNYKAYLKITFPNDKARVINSGPYDNRILIGNIDPNEKWALGFSCAGSSKLNKDNFLLGEYKYDPESGGYKSVNGPKIVFNNFQEEGSYYITQATSSSYSNEEFKQMNLRLCIAPPTGVTKAVYYLEKIELFEATYNGNILITPEEQGNTVDDRAIDKTYYYFYPFRLNKITSADQLVPDYVSKTLAYGTYKPVYNEGAQKVRSVTIKESNYFNILQSIAETFEAWLVLNISRNSITGAIDKKTVCFKNYIGENNYAGFRYGVNLKDIQRTYESKNIVTKLIVKQNSNEHAENGFCTIARAGANPTGENYIYDFQYFFNTGLLNAKDYLETTYVQDGASGSDVGGGTLNLNGYFPRIKKLNNLIEEKSEVLSNTAKDLTQYKAKLKVAEAGEEAAISGTEQAEEDFLSLTGFTIQEVFGNITIVDVALGGKQNSNELAKEAKGYYYSKPSWLQGDLTIQINKTDKSISVTGTSKESLSSNETIYVDAYPKLILSNGTQKVVHYSIPCIFKEGSSNGSGSLILYLADTENTQVKKLYKEYSEFRIKGNNYKIDKKNQQDNVNTTQAIYNDLKEEIDNYLDQKQALNKLFFSQYSRFIQEGTWINEEYVDDEKYYADAQSVMYNSCYPQVAYSINVLELSKLPGYEAFSFKLGDKTYAEDPEFFGEGKKEEVIITELSENLDDPSKNQIKVQNFKNQFQDLFQKITATVQQTQYSTGSYEKAVALAEANQARKQQFLTDALDSASARLSAAGQQSVTWGNDGITVKSINSPCDAIRMVGGAILLSKQDENGEQKWVTGVTSDGVSANLITAGTINVNDIKIMNADEPVFKWDTFGISAYDAVWYDSDIGKIVSNIDTKKFVRYDKYGIYGINNAGVDGENWSPATQSDIDKKATFALTWDGLKVTGNDGVARIGKQDGSIIKITNQSGIDTFIADENGNVTIRGNLQIGDGTPVADAIYFGGKNLLKNSRLWEYHTNQPEWPISKKILKEGTKEFYRIQRVMRPNSNDEDDPEVNTKFSLYNIIYLNSDITEDITNGLITVSFYARGNKERTLRFVCSFFDEQIPNVQDSLEVDVQGSGKDIKITTNWKQYEFTFQTPQAPNGREWDGMRFGPSHKEESRVWGFELDICQLKIEKGSKATDWSSAPEDATDTKGNFSWQLSPREGMFMWNGQQHSATDMDANGNQYGPTRGAVFAIYNAGTRENPEHKLQMKGIIEAEGGSIAGWTIGSNGLTKGTLGSTSDYPFHMYTSFPDEKTTTVAGYTANDWRLIVGNNFGVTKDGGVYATKGKIGQMEMGELVNRASAAVGENLLLNSNVEITNNEYEINSYVPVNYLKEGEIYTITVNATPGKGVKYLGVYFSYGSSLVAWLEFTSNTTEGQRPQEILSATFTMQYHEGMSPEQSADYAKLRLYRFDSNGIGNNSSTTNFSDTTIHWVKIEKGEVSTPWCLAQQEQQSNSVNGNYSWKFSPTEGIKMWNGAQTTDPIFMVDGEGLYISGKGEFKGGLGTLRVDDLGIQGNNFGISQDGIFFGDITSSMELKKGNNGYTIKSTGGMSIEGQTTKILLKNYGAGAMYYLWVEVKTTLVRTFTYDADLRLFWGSSTGTKIKAPEAFSGPIYFWRSLGLSISDIKQEGTLSGLSISKDATEGEWSTFSFSRNPNYNNYLLFGTTANRPSMEYQILCGEEIGTTYGNTTKSFEEVGKTEAVGLVGNLIPENDNLYYLGQEGKRWKSVWSATGNIQTSDKNEKMMIEPFLQKYEILFDNLLPCRYKFIINDSNRYHSGFISQDVEEAILKANLTGQDFAGFIKYKKKEGVGYGLRYDEFIALNTWQIQKLKPRMASAEEKLIAYEARISALETEIENLKSSQNSDII